MHPGAWAWDWQSAAFVVALAAGYLLAIRIYPTARRQVWLFLSGLLLVLAAFLTPVDTLALHYLLSAHLLQNVVLAEWAPALAVFGLSPALAAALGRLQPVRAFTRPLVALPLWLGTYFAWHLPWAYDYALRNPGLLHVEHLTYFLTGLAVWWPVAHTDLRAGAKAIYLFAAFVLSSPIGLLLALLPRPIYVFYVDGPRAWGISALTDQQIGGISMASEQAIVFFAFFAFWFFRFMAEEAAEGTLDPLRRSGA